MNVLVVDDQIPVVEGLVNHIHWDKLEVGRVFSACCAEDAKKIIRDREIDLLCAILKCQGKTALVCCAGSGKIILTWNAFF